MSLTLELSRSWESLIAKHRDRHRFSGVDLFESDLPEALAQGIAKVGTGGTAVHGEVSATVIDVSPDEADGYLPLLFTLKNGTGKQSDLASLDGLAEPYTRPHDDDAAFYANPRFVSHLDANALSAWRDFTARFVRPESSVLDLMASHDSHLPVGLQPTRLTGLGMNVEELAHNTALTERIVHDLNADPVLPFADAQFDVVLCALSIEYLARPEAVLRETRRPLKPGGCCIVSFSHRWFPPKAVEPWPALHPFTRVAWVLRHLQRAGFADLHTESLRGLPRPADDKYSREAALSDPLYAAWGFA